jgi:hypothetical protein
MYVMRLLLYFIGILKIFKGYVKAYASDYVKKNWIILKICKNYTKFLVKKDRRGQLFRIRLAKKFHFRIHNTD